MHMVAQKNSTHATLPKTGKGRQRQKAPIASDATEASAGAEVVPTQAAPTPAEPAVAEPSAQTPVEPTAAEPTAGSLASVSPTPTEETTAATADSSSELAAQKLSALDAAAKVLRETGQAMTCAALIATMAARGYWQSRKGRTPAATLYAALLRELQTKGEQARFVKVQRGKFALREAL
jgi:HB1/ASXL restriction endonuclease-like protein with HTH domain